MFRNLDIENKLVDFKNTLFDSKEYWVVFLILIVLMGVSTCSAKNFAEPNFELIIFFIAAILGTFCIVYYFMHNKDEELYKVVFVIIICFGLVCCLILPVCEVSDESEHLTRAEITSTGVIFPHWTGEDYGLTRTYNITDGDVMAGLNKNAGYFVPSGMYFYYTDVGSTVFETSHDTDKMDFTPKLWYSAFEQNPFYGYLPQAIGIAIAKLLDLNVIWLLWLGRICNLLFYAGIVAYAIKKTPYLKIPLMVVACFPTSIYQASSVSIDAMIMGLGILAAAFFIYLIKSPKDSIENKELIIFMIICLLLGLCKLPYLAFIFLLLLVPKENIKNKNHFYKLILIFIVGVSVIGLMWSNYSEPTLLHSWRSRLFYINSTAQIDYYLTNPNKSIDFIIQIFTKYLVKLANQIFTFYDPHAQVHHSDHYDFITPLLQLFFAAVLLIYPRNVKFEGKTRVGLILLILIIYVGTCVIQLLTWSPVGDILLGISVRYFIPLLALIPIIGGIYSEKVNEDINHYTMVFTIAFAAALILACATKYY